MNTITISKLDDLQEVLDAPLCISDRQSEETYHNMWCITLGDVLVKNIKQEDLICFLDRLIKKRVHQLHDANVEKDIIFYVWFDKQALQLRFNFITGDLSSLPFQCKVRVVDIVDSIVSDFINTAQSVAQSGDDIEFFYVGDSDWDEDDEEDYELDVFTKVYRAGKN